MEAVARPSVADNIERVRERIAAACARAGRQPGQVALVGVTKTHPAEVVVEGVLAGLRQVGENRVQEAAAKVPRVAQLLASLGSPAPEWHLIGHLQTNKAAAALSCFGTIESVDSVRLAEALSRRLGPGTLPVLLEVYVGEDAERPGLRPGELAEAVGRIVALPGLQLRGLMTVAPLDWGPAATRGAFVQVRELRNGLAVAFPGVHWGVLSMGMSGDFETAVEEGSTSVRIGRAIFGARE